MADLAQLEAALVKADAAGNAEDARALATEIRRMRTQPQAAPKQEPSLLASHPLVATADTVAALGSGAVAAPVAGLAGVVQGIKNMISPGMPAGDRVRQVQEALSYQPRTEGGQAATGAIAAPFEALAGVADTAGGAVTDATGLPAAGAAVNTAIQAVPALIAGPGGRAAVGPVNARAARIQAEAAAARSRNAPRDQTLAAGQAEGYVVPPSAVNPSFVNRRIESLAGKDALKQEASIRNQEVTNRIARREVGLQPDDPITPATLDAVRDRVAQPYREVAALPPIANTNPLAGQFNVPRNSVNPAADLEALRNARHEAQTQFRFYDRSADPEALRRGNRAWTEAQRLERNLELAAIQAGRPELVPQLRAARQQIARTYDVERALNVGDGNVDARTLGRLLDRGKPMTGGLATTGRFAEAFGPYVREAGAVPTPGVSKVGPLAAGLMGVGGATAMGPAGAALSGLPLLSHPARGLVLSPTYQQLRAQPAYANPMTFTPDQATTLSALLAAMQAQQQ
jgi:hypothetical protein